jgi:hypothetical protein
VFLDVVPILPLVAFTRPNANETFPAGGALALSASATYALGPIARVEFFSGALKLGQQTTASGTSYSLTLPAGLTPGAHALTARAVAADGAVGISAPISVVATTSAPVIALTSPSNNTTLPANSPFTLMASASDADGAIAKVEFFQGVTKLGEDASAPFSWELGPGLPVGTYAFTARATDNSGFTTMSTAVSVSFSGYAGPAVARIVTPGEDSRLTQPVSVSGVVAHASLAGWSLHYRLKAPDGAPPESWEVFATGTSPVGTPASSAVAESAGAIATFDPTRLINGIYELQLRVTGNDGQVTLDRAEPMTVVVEGNMRSARSRLRSKISSCRSPESRSASRGRTTVAICGWGTLVRAGASP